MSRATAISLASGLVFGAGLAVSGMADPARVRAFLDVTGSWDPTLAFVMAGSLIPMAVAWRIRARLRKPLAAGEFHIPATTMIDPRLVGGAVLFGIGWGVAGLCPGPAIADLALRPVPSAIFVAAMLVGMLAHKILVDRKPIPEESPHAVQQA